MRDNNDRDIETNMWRQRRGDRDIGAKTWRQIRRGLSTVRFHITVFICNFMSAQFCGEIRNSTRANYFKSSHTRIGSRNSSFGIYENFAQDVKTET